MIAYCVLRGVCIIGVLILFVAVCWETVHLFDWANTLYARHGDGSVAGYLRMHAYTYMEYIFGNPLEWRVG